MSLSHDRSTAIRLQREIGDLRSREAVEMKKEADATRRMSSALSSAARASSASSASMYHSTAEREQRSIQAAQDSRARHSADIARKSQDLVRLQDRISREEEAERRKNLVAEAKRRKEDEKARKDATRATERLRAEYEARVDNLEAQIAAQIEAQASATAPFRVAPAEGREEPYDFSFSHASTDKAEFADGLVAKAEAAGLKVWYDRFQIEWGASIRQSIDDGLRNCYFGVVLLSPNFLNRPWTNYELDGILQRDLSGHGRLLPIWHRLTQDDVEKYAPSLAGRLALSTASSTTEKIVEELIRVRDQFKAATEMPDSA